MFFFKFVTILTYISIFGNIAIQTNYLTNTKNTKQNDETIKLCQFVSAMLSFVFCTLVLLQFLHNFSHFQTIVSGLLILFIVILSMCAIFVSIQIESLVKKNEYDEVKQLLQIIICLNVSVLILMSCLIIYIFYNHSNTTFLEYDNSVTTFICKEDIPEKDEDVVKINNLIDFPIETFISQIQKDVVFAHTFRFKPNTNHPFAKGGYSLLFEIEPLQNGDYKNIQYPLLLKIDRSREGLIFDKKQGNYINGEALRLMQLYGSPRISNIVAYIKNILIQSPKGYESAIVIPKYETSLDKWCQTKSTQVLPLDVVAHIGREYMLALKCVHNGGFVYIDIERKNVCVDGYFDQNQKYPKLKIIDFGGCDEIKNNQERQNFINNKQQKVVEGSFPFESVNAHKYYVTNFKDDIESLLYVMQKMLIGALPWSNLDSEKHNKEILYLKETFTTSKSIHPLVKELLLCLHETENDEPDYDKLESIMNSHIPEETWDEEYQYNYQTLKNTDIEFLKLTNNQRLQNWKDNFNFPFQKTMITSWNNLKISEIPFLNQQELQQILQHVQEDKFILLMNKMFQFEGRSMETTANFVQDISGCTNEIAKYIVAIIDKIRLN
jgi:serine/threonine protein kinase